MTDIATLGFAVDTGTIKQANQDLKSLEQSSRQVETTAERMARQFNQAMKSIQQSVKGTINAYEQLDNTVDVLQMAFYAATGQMSKFAKEGAKVFVEWRDEAEKTAKEASRLEQSMTLLQKALIMAGVGIGIGQLIKYTDVYGRMTAQLGQSIASQSDYNDALESLYQISQQTGQGVEDVVKLYAQMARSTQALAISQQQLLDVTGMVNKMLMMAQLPAESASAALFQFQQAMASGVLRGEELNSMLEQMPPLATAIATGMRITVGQLSKFGAEGALTSKNVLAALLSQKDAINAQFDAMMGGATTMSNLMSRADNAMVMLIGRADEMGGATLAMQGAFAALTDFLDSPDTATTMAMAFEKIGVVIKMVVDVIAAALPYLDEFFGLWLGAKGLAALASLAAGIVVAYIKFELLSIIVTVATTAVARFGATLGLTAAQIAAVTGTLGSMGAAFGALQKLMAVGALLGGVMTLVSGIAMIVAGVTLFMDTTTDAQKSADSYRENLNLLGRTADDVAASFAKMNEEQKKNAVQQTEVSISQKQTALSTTTGDMEAYLRELLSDQAAAFSYRNGTMSVLAPEMKFSDYQAELKRMNAAFADGGKNVASYIEHLKNIGAVTDEEYQKIVTLNGTLQGQREELDKLNAKYRIITDTRMGNEQQTLGENAALAVQNDMLSKNTEELTKNIAKLRERVETAGMTPVEKIERQVQGTNFSDAQLQQAKSLTTLEQQLAAYAEGLKSADTAAVAAAESVMRLAEEQYLQGVKTQAMAENWKSYQSAIKDGSMDAHQAMKLANEAGDQAVKQTKEQINVQTILARVEREAAEARQKAYEAASRAAQQSIENALTMAEAWGKGSKAAREMEAQLKAMERAKTESAVPISGKMSSGSLDLNALVQAIIKIESAGRSNAVSNKGATGLMQIMPGTAKFLGYSPSEMLDPQKNVEAGTKYIKMMLDRYIDKVTGEFDVNKALAAYNAGPGNVDKYGGVPPFKETQDYVKKVGEEYSRQVLIKQELAKLDADALKTGAQQITQLKEKTDLTKLQTNLLKGQYTNVQTADGVLISADKIRESMEMLKSYGLTQGQAADEVTKAIEATQGITNAQQALQMVEEQLKTAIADRLQTSAAATLEAQKQTQVIGEQVAATQTLAQALADLNRDGQVMLTATVAGTGQVIDAGLATSQQAVESYYQLLEKINAEVKKLTEQGASSASIQANVDALVGQSNTEQLKKITDLTAGLEEQRKELENSAPSWAELTGQVEAHNAVQETADLLNQIVTVGIQAETEAQKALAMENARAVDEAKNLNAVMATVTDYYQKSLTPMERYAAELKKIEKARKLLDERKDQGIISPEQLEQERRGLEQWREEAQKIKDEADPLAQAFKSAAEGIYNAWSGMWESLFTQGISGFSDVVEQIKTMFLKMLAQLAASALAKPILLPIIQTMGGMFGMDNAGMAPIINNLFGAGTMGAGGAGGGLGGLGGLTSNLSSGFGLFGGGGIGSMVGGAISGLGGLMGGGTGAITGLGAVGEGLMEGGNMMGQMGLFSGMVSSFTSGLSSIASGAISTGIGLVASAAIPVIGAIASVVSMLGDLGPTPHPSSFAIAGSWPEGHGSYTGYQGKGDWVKGDSGLSFGYAYGHTDPKEAQGIRDALMEMDSVMADLVPGIDLANARLGGFGNTAEGFIAGVEDTRFASMDEVAAEFVQAWVGAAAETGAVSELVNQALQSMTGTAEELLTAFSALQEMDAAGNLNQQMIDIALALESGSDKLTNVLTALGTIQSYTTADPLADFEILLNESLKTTFDRLGDAGKAMAEGVMDDAGKVMADGLEQVDWTDATSIQELAGLVQQRYAMELQMLMEVNAYLNGIAESFSGSIEEIQMSVMDNAQKYAVYSEQAAAAFAALQTATDPAEIARLAEEARQSTMSAYGLLDDKEKGQVSAEFISFLEQTQSLAQEKLNSVQETVMEQHQDTAKVLADALQQAGEAAAAAIKAAIEQAATAIENAGNSAGSAIRSAIDAMEGSFGAARSGMAAGGFVGGTWNGQAGISGDTVATMLTPGEAVISREQTQKHRPLLDAVMKDQVEYAAAGALPGYPTGKKSVILSGGAGGGKDSPGNWGGGSDGLAESLTELDQLMRDVSQEMERMDWGQMQSALADINDQMQSSINRALELGASEDQLNQIRTLAEMKVQELYATLLAGFDDSLEAIQLSVMTDAEKYAHYTEVAESAFEALRTATDSGEIERLAEEARSATMDAWGMLDESQRKSMLSGFEQFLVDAQALTEERLGQSASAVQIAAQDLQDMAQDTVVGLEGAANRIQEALATPINVNVTVDSIGGATGMAGGGMVGGQWNGQAGLAGDTVVTMLTPGEAVIPREATQKHRPLIESIMADNVRYAAFGSLPPANIATGGRLPGWVSPYGDGSDAQQAADEAAQRAEQLADLIEQLTREFRDLTLSDFDRQLANLNDTLIDTTKRINELGGSAEALSLAQAIQAEREQQLRDEQARQQAAFLQPYQDAADGLTLLDQALRDLDRKTENELARAADLGITDTSLITDQRDREAAALQSDNANQLAELLAGVAEPLGELDQQMQDLRDSTKATREQAKKLGATYGELQEVNKSYLRQMEEIAKAAYEERSAILATYAIDQPSELQAAITDLWKEAETAQERFIELGGSVAESAAIAEGAAAMEAKLREEQAQSLADLMNSFSLNPLSAFEQQLADLVQTAKTGVQQAESFGASQEQLVQIETWATQETLRLTQERSEALADLMEGFSLEPVTEFQQSLIDVTKQAQDAQESAKELGASHEQLAQIDAWAAQESARLSDERRKALADLMVNFDTQPTTAFNKALHDMNRQMEANLEQAIALGGTEADLAKIREWTSETAIRTAQQAIDEEISVFEDAAAVVAQTLEQISNSLRQLKDGIEANLLDFNRLQPDWNEVSYQSGRVTDLKGQLDVSDGLPLDQRISLAEQLREAVMARYQAEMTAQQALQQEQAKADAEQRQNLERMVQIAKNLKNYLNSLKLSDLSTLSPEQKLQEAQQQYADTLSRAQSGDIVAQGELQGAAQAYLQEARSYYASTEAYAGIFGQVTATLEGLASVWKTQGEGEIAALDAKISPYETQSLEFAAAAVTELQAILPLLGEWQAQATATAKAETEKLRETLNANTTAITRAVSSSGLVLAGRLDAAVATMTAAVTSALEAVGIELQSVQAQAVAAQQAAAAAMEAAMNAQSLAVSLQQTTAPLTGHADGGRAYGWSLVGEEGPELVNFTAPSRVYTAADTRMMLADNDSSEDTEAVVMELKALIRLQSSANQQLIGKLDAVESRLAGIESKARLEAAA